MIGTPTVNNIWTLIYYPLVFLIVAGFGAYDCKYKRVPDLALVLFLQVALLAPAVQAGGFIWGPLLRALLTSCIGAAGYFLILLAAALLSKETAPGSEAATSS